MIVVDSLRLKSDDNRPLRLGKISFALPATGITALLGPNGSGKTTLLRAMLGEPLLLEGTIRLRANGMPIRQLRATDLARLIAYLPQDPIFPEHLDVMTYVGRGLIPITGLWGDLSGEQLRLIDETLHELGLSTLKHTRLGGLSSGERQRAHLARALVQKTPMIFLDEPTNHLDPGSGRNFWRVLRKEVGRLLLLAVVITHDLTAAHKHADHVLALGYQKLQYFGPAANFFETNLEKDLYN
jgi:iron complex transport system ATP-binding protein